MGKVSRDKMGTRTPKLTPDDFEGDVVIATIAGYEEFEVDDGGEGRLCATLVFEETGDKALFLNATQMDDLIAGFGSDDWERWIGKQVPLEKRVVTFKGKKHDKVYVVAHEEWDRYLKPKRLTGARGKAAKKKATRRGSK